MTDPAAAREQELKCPQPGGEAVADRDKSDRCQGDTPSSGERLRDEGQAGRSGEKSPTLSPETIPADPVAANTATRETVSNRLYVGSTTPSSDAKCLHGQRGGEEPDSALDKMGVDKSPRAAQTTGGMTQEVKLLCA